MKTSDIYKINRSAESGALTEEQYAKLHEQIAYEKLDNKLTKAEAEDINKWLTEQTKDVPDDIEFLDTGNVQKAHYFDELKQISTSHDKQTEANLEQLSDKQVNRDEAISKHLNNQRMALAKAITQRAAAEKEYFQKRDELVKLQTKYTDLRTQSDQQHAVINEKREQFTKLDQLGITATEDIKLHYSKNDNFDIKADAQISAPEYALRKARSFAESQQQLADTATQQQDPDVRMRIEMEQLRRESAFRRDQNINIQGLTGQTRAGEIETHESNERAASIEAAKLDMKLEAKSIKIDFSEAEPEIRTIHQHEILEEKMHHDLASIEIQVIVKNELAVDNVNEQLLNKDVNKAAFEMDNKAVEVSEARNKVENKIAEVIERKLSLTDRLKQNRELAIEKNQGTIMSSRQSAMLAEARANQLHLAEQARLQQNKEQQVTHVQSR